MSDEDLLQELENQKLAAKRFERLFQGLPIACIGFDLDGTIFEWNRTFETLFGFHAGALFMASLSNLMCHDDAQFDQFENLMNALRQGREVCNFEWEFSPPGAEPKVLLCSMLPSMGLDGTGGGGMLAGIDMTAQKRYEVKIVEQLAQINEYSQKIEHQKRELEQANARLASMASTDVLTGLRNRRAMEEALSRSLADATPNGLSIILLDVDHFKQFNDTFGHPEGDEVLRQVGLALLTASRPTEVVARFGGEEFLVLLPTANVDVAMRVAERMRRAIEAGPWPKRLVTASFGVATYTGPADTDVALLAMADEALYASKHGGRNRVTHFNRNQSVAA